MVSTNYRKGSSFCNKTGAVANEDLSFSEYIESLDRGQEEPSNDVEEGDEKEKKKDEKVVDKKGDGQSVISCPFHAGRCS